VTLRAPKPNQHERAQRRATIDVLLTRALRGVLTIPEAAVLADYTRAEQRLADKTRQSLGDTTRALASHRQAADAAIREAEQRAERADAAIARIQAAAALNQQGLVSAAELHAVIEAALDEPAPRPAPIQQADTHDAGPTVREAAAQDACWWNDKHAGEAP
jgi:nitrogen fixation/metabolism regulation signal transduction histidine kinase